MRLSSLIALLCAAGIAAGALLLAHEPAPRARVEATPAAAAGR